MRIEPEKIPAEQLIVRKGASGVGNPRNPACCFPVDSHQFVPSNSRSGTGANTRRCFGAEMVAFTVRSRP
jgi:hypothetical protein